jgi:hypothetical protein
MPGLVECSSSRYSVGHLRTAGFPSDAWHLCGPVPPSLRIQMIQPHPELCPQTGPAYAVVGRT